MVVPLIVGGSMVASSAVGFGMGLGRAYDNYRWWRDYEKNTGVHARYPFRAGRYDYADQLSRSFRSFGMTAAGAYGLYKS